MHGQSLYMMLFEECTKTETHALSLIIAMTHDHLRKVVEVPWTTHAAFVQMCISACACMQEFRVSQD